MKTRIAISSAIAAATLAMGSCASNPESDALAREAFRIALAEFQRQHPVTPEK